MADASVLIKMHRETSSSPSCSWRNTDLSYPALLPTTDRMKQWPRQSFAPLSMACGLYGLGRRPRSLGCKPIAVISVVPVSLTLELIRAPDGVRARETQMRALSVQPLVSGQVSSLSLSDLGG